MSTDATARGALIGKSTEATKVLLEDMATNNYPWSSKWATSKRSSCKYDIDVVDMLKNKVDGLTQRFDRMGTPTPGSSSGMMYEVSVLCEVCSIQGHLTIGCQAYFQGVEQTNAMQKFNPRP